LRWSWFDRGDVETNSIRCVETRRFDRAGKSRKAGRRLSGRVFFMRHQAATIRREQGFFARKQVSIGLATRVRGTTMPMKQRRKTRSHPNPSAQIVAARTIPYMAPSNFAVRPRMLERTAQFFVTVFFYPNAWPASSLWRLMIDGTSTTFGHAILRRPHTHLRRPTPGNLSELEKLIDRWPGKPVGTGAPRGRRVRDATSSLCGSALQPRNSLACARFEEPQRSQEEGRGLSRR